MLVEVVTAASETNPRTRSSDTAVPPPLQTGPISPCALARTTVPSSCTTSNHPYPCDSTSHSHAFSSSSLILPYHYPLLLSRNLDEPVQAFPPHLRSRFSHVSDRHELLPQLRAQLAHCHHLSQRNPLLNGNLQRFLLSIVQLLELRFRHL